MADFISACLLLLLLSPAMLLIALAIKLESSGSVFFVQKRLGQHRHEIGVIRFRTVRQDSAVWQRTLRQERLEPGVLEVGVTRVGRLLLRSKFDRLPELFNVVRGEMSLVGPRPAMPFELEGYGYQDWIRMRARPGLTGLWQLTPPNERVSAESYSDQAYMERMSPALDLAILLRTIAALITGKLRE